jgi:hypothetical protein
MSLPIILEFHVQQWFPLFLMVQPLSMLSTFQSDDRAHKRHTPDARMITTKITKITSPLTTLLELMRIMKPSAASALSQNRGGEMN